MIQKMYSITLMHLSGIQKGIQHGHGKDVFELIHNGRAEYKRWLKTDKTVIVLQTYSVKQLLEAKALLAANEVPHAIFYEEDLANIPTAVSFLVDERVWDKETYPDIDFQIGYVEPKPTPAKMRKLREDTQYAANTTVYGKEVAWLRAFLRNYDLATN